MNDKPSDNADYVDNTATPEETPPAAKKPARGNVFRGDKVHRPGSEPIGKPIDDSISEAEKARIARDHVKQRIRPEDSVFTSWSSSAVTARDKFAGGDPQKVTKVSYSDLHVLEAGGQVKIWFPEDVAARMKVSGDAKLAKQANAVMQDMKRNREILVEGVIPASVQRSMS
jgi:hypothetical protein